MDHPALPPDDWKERYRAIHAEQAALLAQAQALNARLDVVGAELVEEVRKWVERQRRQE